LYEFEVWTVLLRVENYEEASKLSTEPLRKARAKCDESIFVSDDKHCDIACDKSFQNGDKFSPPIIESAANFCNGLASWIFLSKALNLSVEVIF
jgi:hypothetical protein